MKRLSVLAICILLGAGTLVGAAEAAADADEKKVGWYDKVKWGGDLRLRVEHFNWPGNFDGGKRSRFRFRLRFGLEARLRHNLRVGFEMRSGDPLNPHSDNQSFDTAFSKKEIAISQAFARWGITDWLELSAGKFRPKGLWMATDEQWDDDVVAEGLFWRFHWDGGGVVKEWDLNLYQFELEESGSGPESYLLGGQFAPILQFGKKNTLTVGVDYMGINHPEDVAALTLSGRLASEPELTVTNLLDPVTGGYVSQMKILSVFAIWKNKSLGNWPITWTNFYYKNIGARDAIGSMIRYNAEDDEFVPLDNGLNSKDNDTAFFTRFQIGDYKRPGQMAFRLARYQSEPDAMFYPYVQSDTRRGTNLDGWRFDYRIGMPVGTWINVTWYHTDYNIPINPVPIDSADIPGLRLDAETMDRWQLDYIFRF
jgi:hypothetical protein